MVLIAQLEKLLLDNLNDAAKAGMSETRRDDHSVTYTLDKNAIKLSEDCTVSGVVQRGYVKIGDYRAYYFRDIKKFISHIRLFLDCRLLSNFSVTDVITEFTYFYYQKQERCPTFTDNTPIVSFWENDYEFIINVETFTMDVTYNYHSALNNSLMQRINITSLLKLMQFYARFSRQSDGFEKIITIDQPFNPQTTKQAAKFWMALDQLITSLTKLDYPSIKAASSARVFK